MKRLGVLLAACLACEQPKGPLEAALPPLPPVGGPRVAAAGRLTSANFDQERVPGPVSQGLPGDYFMRNDKLRVVVQAPGRAIGPCPFGGNIIDVDLVERARGDQLGEVSPFLQLGRTIDFNRAEVTRDGSQGGAAVLRFFGRDVKDDYLDLPGVGSFALGIQDDYRATNALDWEAAVTYILEPGATRVRMIYTFYNPGKLDRKTLWGTLSDTGAHIEVWHPFTGYGEIGFDVLLGGADKPPAVAYGALHGEDIAYGIVPVYADAAGRGAAVPVAGVDVEVYDIQDPFDAFGEAGQSLMVKVGGTASREVDLVAGDDVASVTAQAQAIRNEAALAVSGTTEPGARVTALLDGAPSEAALLTTFTAGADGRFSGALPAASYTFQAEGAGFRRSPPVTTSMLTDLTLPIPAAAQVAYTIHDAAGQPIPGRITVVGAPATAPDRHFRDVAKDFLPHGIAAMAFSLAGDSSLGTRHDQPLALVAGHYRVVVSRGPEWSRFEQVIDLGAGEIKQVDAVLDHVVPTPGYLACDFHQHSYFSPDSPIAPEDKVVGYVDEGVDFISSSEHDVHFDYAPVIAGLGAERLLASAVGVETTPWDYGHFIAWPMTVDPLSPNGGALDWANGDPALSLAPGQIFDGLRGLGAKVVQVNHPRTPPKAISSFQQNFDRAQLTFDFANHTFYGDQATQPILNATLGLPDDALLFSDKFDALEIYNLNGTGPANNHLAPMPIDGERADVVVEATLRDWMNFLSFGFTPTAVGDSDSHELKSYPQGLPRTLVAVPDDTPGAPGLIDEVAATVGGKGRPRDVIVTNGPFLQLTVDGMGIGRTVAHATGPLAIHVSVQTPSWIPVDTVEVFANNTFDIPGEKGSDPAPLVPALCFTSKAAPSMRCQMAIGGARPLAVSTVQVSPGATRLEIAVDANDVTPDMLLLRQRAGAQGSDLWMVARATGETALFPVIPIGVADGITVGSLVDQGAGVLAGSGVPALAFTNPVFVDVDGNGWRGAFQP
jgi:hypothetical protein